MNLNELEILEDEYVSALGFLGVTSTNQLNSNHVCQSDPVTNAHEMSTWVNMPKGRLT